jgi:hypothetical protein
MDGIIEETVGDIFDAPENAVLIRKLLHLKVDVSV